MTFVLPSLNRGRDSTRKSDLQRIASALEEYYNNKGSYPPQLASCGQNSEISDVLPVVPCDPATKDPYLYIAHPDSCSGTDVSRCSGYRLLANLVHDKDPDIEKKGCTINFTGVLGCHKVGTIVYDYGIAVGRSLRD